MRSTVGNGQLGRMVCAVCDLFADDQVPRSQEFDSGAERSVRLKGCYGRCEN